ncbi:MAG TPA: 3-hydroxyacyl-CoA dehydrogenase NAD-binding domain-containing protein [Thermoleophilia bacterium]|nr:3-hydroxyacyl-CoA dehydrogenase NAD-binding domain-containing protein [Thermoleophilia bacterium]
MKNDVKKIGIIGGGNMGHGCAMVFAAAGYPVGLYSRRAETLEKGIEAMRSDLTFLAERGLGKPTDVEEAMARVTTTQAMEEAAADADFVLECVAEDMALKQDTFQKLDQMCKPEAILATNTSVMSPTEIASKAEKRDRIIGTHWWNPPFLIPLVEVVQTEENAPWVIDVTMALHWAIGKHPVHCKKDVPGFVANRLQHALWREAISIVERGIADAATVDESLKFGPGLRLPVLAPLETADMGGLDLTLAIHSYVLKHLEDSHEPSPLLKEKVAKNELGFKTGGVGFQTWTPEQMKATRERLLEYLARVAVSAADGKA